MITRDIDLMELPEPVMPRGLSRGIQDSLADVSGAAQESASAPSAAHDGSARARTVRFFWVLALLGLTLAVGAEVYRVLVGESMTDFSAVRWRSPWEGPWSTTPWGPAFSVLMAGSAMAGVGLYGLCRAMGPRS